LTTRTLTRTDATSAVTSHMRNKRIENWRTARGGGGPTVIDSRGTGGPPGARRADRESYRERALHPTAVRSVIQAGLAKLAAVSGSPAAPDGGSLTCTSISEGGWPPGSGPRAGAWSAQGGSHPSASGCKRSNARTPPWPVVAVAESQKGGAVGVWLAGWPRSARGCGTAGFPGCGPHPVGHLRQPLGIPRLAATRQALLGPPRCTRPPSLS
jgi:hypothetical protein